MKPQDFVKELNRMCKRNRVLGCDACPLINAPCSSILHHIKAEEFPEMYRAVEAWSNTHPIETRQRNFLRKFPHAEVNQIDGFIRIFPCQLNSEMEGTEQCKKQDCQDCRRKYWSESIDLRSEKDG